MVHSCAMVYVTRAQRYEGNMKNLIAATLITTVTATSVFAHGGGLNSKGCHNNHSNGTYHCHQNRNTNDKELKNLVGAAVIIWGLNALISGKQQRQQPVYQQPVQHNHTCHSTWEYVAQNNTHIKFKEVNCHGVVVGSKVVKK